jgi:hypothetical protein
MKNASNHWNYWVCGFLFLMRYVWFSKNRHACLLVI